LDGLKRALTGLLGAVPAGVAREQVARAINPSQNTLPVARRAWYVDAGTLAAGILAKALAEPTRQEWLDEIGDGLLLPGAAYSSEDLAHTIQRNMTTPAASVATPTQVAQVRTARPVPLPAPAARPPLAYQGYSGGLYDSET
jgi:hypothetical protein